MIKNVCVIGGGVLGSQIAFQSAYCGFNVTILAREGEVDNFVKPKLNNLYNIYKNTISEMTNAKL